MTLGLRPALWVCLLLCIAMGSGRWCRAEEKDPGMTDLDLRLGSEPIRVSAKSLEWDHKAHKATFHQEVVAQQENLAIYSDDLIIYFSDDDTDITRLVSKGNVKIVQMDRRASCDEAVYDRSRNVIVLKGDPIIRQGENEIRGERVIFYVEENRSVVEGGETGRVRVTLIPEKDKSITDVP